MCFHNTERLIDKDGQGEGYTMRVYPGVLCVEGDYLYAAARACPVVLEQKYRTGKEG